MYARCATGWAASAVHTASAMRRLSISMALLRVGASAETKTTLSSSRSKRCSVAAASGLSRSSSLRVSARTGTLSAARRAQIAPPTKPPAPTITTRRGALRTGLECSSTAIFLGTTRRYPKREAVEAGRSRGAPIEYPIGIKDRAARHDPRKIGRLELAEGRPRRHDGKRIDALGRGKRALGALRPRMAGSGGRNHRVVDLEPARPERRDQRERGRVLRRMGIFLISEAEDADERVHFAGEHLVMQHPRRPVAAMAAVGNEGLDDARLGAGLLRQSRDGREIALEIAAGDAQPGREIGALPDAGVELERRYDFAPVGANALGKFRQRIGDRYRGDQTAIDRDLGELRAFVSHRQDRTAERTEHRREGLGQRLGRIGAADDIPLRSGRALDRAAEHQRLDLVEQPLGRQWQTAGEPWWNLTQHDEQRARGERRHYPCDRCRNAGEIALAMIIGRHVGRNVDEVTGGEVFNLAGK